MDAPKESYDKNIHVTSTTKNDTSSNLSSDSDQTQKTSQKKRKERKTSKPLLTPDYFPMYTPPWATMNYIYLDLLRQLSLESEIMSSLTKIDKSRYEYSYLKESQTKNKLEEGKCCARRKIRHKLCNCEDFEMSCSHLCLSCHQRVKCNACGQAILQSRAPETAVKEIQPCKCVYDSCPTHLDQQHIHLGYCHYHCEKPTHPSQTVCGNFNCISVDTPVREVPDLYTSIRRDQNSLDSEACNESNSNLAKFLNENCCGVDTGDAKHFGSKNQPVLQIENEDVKKQEFEDDHRIVPSFLGGTGDEGPKLQPKVKRTRKSRLPRSTAYFLPISSLSKN